jgi:hypothetical protein
VLYLETFERDEIEKIHMVLANIFKAEIKIYAILTE